MALPRGKLRDSFFLSPSFCHHQFRHTMLMMVVALLKSYGYDIIQSFTLLQCRVCVCDCDCVCRCERKRVESEREKETEYVLTSETTEKKKRRPSRKHTAETLYFFSRNQDQMDHCLPVCTVVAEVCGEFQRRQNSVDNKNWRETEETTIEIAEKREWEWHAELLGLIGVSAAVSLAWLLKLLKSLKFKSWNFYCCRN